MNSFLGNQSESLVKTNLSPGGKRLLEWRWAVVVVGDVIDEEVETAVMAMAEERSSVANAATAISTNFTCGSHFYEEVEDLKDSVWVVQVIRDRQRPFISHRDWKAFVKKVSRFGVQTGIFDCSFDHTSVSVCAVNVQLTWTVNLCRMMLVIIHSYIIIIYNTFSESVC